MNESTTEAITKIKSPQMAHEAARAYEAALDGPSQDDPPRTDTPNNTSFQDALPRTDPPNGVTSNSAELTNEASSKPALPNTDIPSTQNRSTGLRLCMKVWTDPQTRKRYLMPTAFLRDVVRGEPVTDVMYAYAMSNEHTRRITLTAAQWNALPFFYFQEDGWAPRASERPLNTIK